MAKTVVHKYRIYEGPDKHAWFTGDPPTPVARYKVVRFVIVNDEVWEEPTEYQKQHLLPEEYASLTEAIEVSNKLNDEWFLTDPNWEMYQKLQ
jgi:hypothetical protein